MPPAVVVRRATVPDVPELVRLRHAMFRDMVSAGVGAHPEAVDDTGWYAAAHHALAQEIRAGRLGAFVVDDPASRPGPPDVTPGGPLVASALAALEERLPGPGFPRGRTAHLSTVYVEPAHRRRGIARAVVTACVRWAEESGAEIVDLNATPDAEPLYRSLGFTEPRARAMRRVPPAGVPEDGR